MGFVPRKYDYRLVEALALAGALDPEPARPTSAARRSRRPPGNCRWAMPRRSGAPSSARDGTITFLRAWRGVTDAHLIEPGFVGSAEARKLHKLAQEQAEAYAAPARLTKSAAPSPSPSRNRSPTRTRRRSRGEPAPRRSSLDGAITRPSQLLEAVLAAGRKGLAIARYKGLGEMNAEQLWETTLDPDNRVLLQVKVEDADVTDEIFTRLMGDIVEPRREFIQENALNVANLDV